MYEKSEADLTELIKQLQNSFLTKSLNQHSISVIAQSMKKVEIKSGDFIIKYGDVGREYYILKEGKVEVLVYKKGTNPKSPNLAENIERTKELGSGIGFGEIALMYGDKRTASIRASTDCVCWELDGRVFKSIIMNAVVNRRNVEVGYLDKVDLLAKLDRYEKLKLLDGLEAMYFAKGQNIIVEGEQGNYFYIIEEGDVECYKSDGDNELTVRKLEPGAHFGEIALIKGESRSLSIRAISDKVKVLALNREAFTRILGSIENYLKKDYSHEQEAIPEDENE